MKSGLAAVARAVLLGSIAALAVGGLAVQSAEAKTLRLHFARVRQPVIPVLAEISGAFPTGLLRSSTVRVYDVAPRRASRTRTSFPCTTRRPGPLLVGRGSTGGRGVAVVRLCERRAPRTMRILVSGGSTGSGRFRGTLVVQVRYAGHHAVYANPVSTLVARYLIAHPRRGLATAKRLVRQYLRLPSFFDFAGDMAATRLFDGSRFLATARAHGGFDRYVARVVSRLGAGSHAAVAREAVTATEATSSSQCWRQAAQTTKSFAAFLGFTNVPSEGLPSPPPCRPASSQQVQAAAGSAGVLAHAAGLGPNDVLGDLLGVAGLSYSIFSGTSSANQLSSIDGQLTTIQNEMVAVQNSLAQLQTQIANVNANVLQGNVSTLAADAQPTVEAIKVDGADVNALVGALDQLVCPNTVCTTMRLPAPGNVTAAFNALCYPNGTIVAALATECNSVSQAEYNVLLDVKGQKPRQAVSNLAEDALGSAGVGGPATAGIVQYELEAGAASNGFFQTQNASSARLNWAYYTLASIWAQATFAEAAGMGIGQPEPGTSQKHPPLLTAAAAKNGVNSLNATIDAFMGAFPNMPDTAVFDTNLNASDGDSPYMWARGVGGLSVWGAFSGYSTVSWDLDNGGGITSAIGGMSANPLSNSAQAPIVMTPAVTSGQTWVMLPTSGVATVPSMDSARFTDWKLGQGTISASNNQQLDGPLGDLYGQAPAFDSSANQTRGQWMTANSGINPQLLTVSGLGYAPATIGSQPDYNTYAGMFLYYNCNQTDCSNNQDEWAAVCPPAGDTACLLPTYYDNATSPFAANASSTGTATGLFDYNQGQLITNEQGHATGPGTPYPGGAPSGEPFNTNTSQWVNQWGNYDGPWCYKSNECYPGVANLIDSATDASLQQNGAFAANGRPILFDRTQIEANGANANSDCFFWTGTAGSAADGAGCLIKRTKSTQILPAVPTG